LYKGALVQFTYSHIDNSSNSFGYDFGAHRIQFLLARHLTGGVDGQSFVNFQFRKYKDPLGAYLGGSSEVDEFEQTFLSFKLSKQLSGRFGLSIQYGFSRNGATNMGRFYRKHTSTTSLDASL